MARHQSNNGWASKLREKLRLYLIQLDTDVSDFNRQLALFLFQFACLVLSLFSSSFKFSNPSLQLTSALKAFTV
jgi:hypothetical protein